MRLFVILDSCGITTWRRDAVEPRVHRALIYPKYEYRLITNMVYAKKYNCYFVLAKDFSLKVYNKDFVEMCSVCAEMRSVMFLLFNPVRDELITGGVGGTQVWGFYQQSVNRFGDVRAHGSYGLNLKYELPSVGGGWVKHVELDHQLEHLYCCSDHDLYIYDLEGNLLFKFERAHSMSITGCRYSRHASVLITSSLDSEVKVWSLLGGLVHIFRGHSRAITNMILHPATSSIVMTCSLDGTVRMWSLDTMDCLSSVIVSVDGIQWMGLTDDNLLYLGTPRTLTLWNLNYNLRFWALVRSPVTQILRCGCKGKTTRIVAISDDNSVRIIARSSSKSLTTVLPPPNISPLQHVMSVCYSREFSVIYLLVSPQEIWVYTARTDPACRIAVWHMTDIQKRLSVMNTGLTGSKDRTSIILHDKPSSLQKAAENRNEGFVRCCCIAMLTSAVITWSKDGNSCPIRDSFLLVGLEDGRIFFMDPIIKGERYLELKTDKDPVMDIWQDNAHNTFITVHKLKDVMRILVWRVPELTLQHELFTAGDLIDFVMESSILMTGHESGSVVFHTLEPMDDASHQKSRNVPTYEELVDVNHKPEHLASVTAVDVCAALKIFCSCSEDGAIKIWYEKALLTEIVLDSSLSAVCFLNNRGDLLVGYQKHIFYIDHTKVCPQLKIPESDVDSFDKESYICEDPAVLYEGVSPNHDQVTLENYLVPFDIEFSKDFLEGRVTMEPGTVTEEVLVSDDDIRSEISGAPTEIYMSAESTPERRLSYVDLILHTEVNKYDLAKQMKKTLHHLADKESLQYKYPEQMGSQPNKKYQKLKGKKNLRKKYIKSEKSMKFCFPHFGKSPGPTPESSRSPTPEIVSASDAVLEEISPTSEEDHVRVLIVEETKKDNTVTTVSKKEDKEKPELKTTIELFAPRTKFGLADVTVDAKTLMKDTKKVALTAAAVPQHRPGPEPMRIQKVSDAEPMTKQKSGNREQTVKKKMMSTSQRRNIHIKKFEKLEKRHSNIEPPTQMHTLGLIETESDIPTDVSLAGKDDLCLDQDIIRAPIKADNELESINNLTSKMEKATVEDEKSSAHVLLVPTLPCVPLSDARQNDCQPSISKPRSVRSVKGALDTVPDLRSYNDSQESKTSLANLSTNFMGRDISETSENFTDCAVHTEDHYRASTSRDLPTSKTGFILQDQTEIINFLDKSLPNSSAEIVASYENTWQDREPISVPTGLLESPDQYLDNATSFSVDGSDRPGPDFFTQAHFKVVLPPYERLTTKPQSEADIEDRLELDKPELQNVIKYFKQRPHTAHDRYSREDLQAAFEASMIKYKQLFRPSTTSGKLYKNDDLEFSENWHERQIHRHMLLRMQAELRAINVQENQQGINQPEQTDIKELIAEDSDTVNRRNQNAPPKLSASRNHRQTVLTTSQTTNHRAGTLQSTYLRTRTVTGKNQRASTAHGSRPVVTNAESISRAPRPRTVSGTYTNYIQLSKKQAEHSVNMFRQIQQPQGMQTGLSHQSQDHQEKTDLRNEKPFRCRLRQVTETYGDKLHLELDACQPYDPWLLDPRNPQAVRPRSSKSIPSKCYRYILVSKPKMEESLPLPTRLEKYLIGVRFPQEGRRLFRRIRKLLHPESLLQTDLYNNVASNKVN
ncbi:hypothetical protein BsWGS_12006 [Bradybaena similaris]